MLDASRQTRVHVRVSAAVARSAGIHLLFPAVVALEVCVKVRSEALSRQLQVLTLENGRILETVKGR